MGDGDSDPIPFLNRNIPAVPREVIAAQVKARFGVDGDWHPLEGERDQILRLDTGAGRFVVRVSNIAELPRVVDFQVEALRHIADRDPTLPVPRVVKTIDGEFVDSIEHQGTRHLLRLVTYLPGTPLRQIEAEEPQAVRRQLGSTLARLAVAMRGFFHEAAGNEHPWDIRRSPQLVTQLEYIADTSTRANVASVLRRFSQQVLPRLGQLRHQVVHQDAHGGNVLIANGAVSGLIDFGDMVWGPISSEIAIAADPAWANGDPVGALCDVVAGFDQTHPLLPSEVDVLFDFVLARVASTITIEASRQQASSEQSPASEGIDRYPDLLAELLHMDQAEIDRRLRDVGRFPPPIDPSRSPTEGLVQRRNDRLGRTTPHFYDEPLHLEKGDGVWLYAPDGTAYLDFYNNVPQVGHNHPHVVNAISRQVAALNTNTRYLYEGVVAYAERLTALLGPGLDACLFVNSGSEANDVALQMARFITDRHGIIVMDSAYHGVTAATRELSTADSDVEAGDHVAEVTVPDPYRGMYRADDPDCAIRYAEDFDRAIAELAGHGQELAALIVDTVMCSNGMPSIPAGYFAEAERRIRAAGGLVIADEVQAGLGRTGRWWGHELNGLRPDIVTMGKPVGNGYPLGVVVTSVAMLEAFMSRTRLFSTFGGNPVAAAAGMAVLDVIEREGLVENAYHTGAYLREELRELQQSQPLIGDVRGWGMITGIELVTNREMRTPASKETGRLVEAMRANGVLVGTAGRLNNVLKLRPPLVANPEHVDRFVGALNSSLQAMGSSPSQD